MNFSIKISLLFFFLFSSCFVFSQTDTTIKRGTIKVAKTKEEDVYIKAIPNFSKYNLTDIKREVVRNEMYQPFPVMDAYPYPFNYTAYFTNCFKTKEINLKGKTADTVIVEVTVLANGKVYIKDKSKIMMVNGIPAVYNEKQDAYEINNLHVNCLKFLKDIGKWLPGYVVFPKKDKYRGEVVVKPNKKNVDVTGTVTIYFSTSPFED